MVFLSLYHTQGFCGIRNITTDKGTFITYATVTLYAMAQSQLGKYAPHPRTVVVDTVAKTMSAVKTENQVDAILDSSISSTEAAIRNSKPLADWDEYNTEL